MGPYAFQAMKIKTAVEFLDGNQSVRWKEYDYFKFLPELSNGTLDDAITTLNVPLVGAPGWAQQPGWGSSSSAFGRRSWRWCLQGENKQAAPGSGFAQLPQPTTAPAHSPRHPPQARWR